MTTSGRVRVAVRVRPRTAGEGSQQCVRAAPDGTIYLQPPEPDSLPPWAVDRTERASQSPLPFSSFDFTYAPTTTSGNGGNTPSQPSNEQIWKDIGRQALQAVLEGYNCSIFAYGATGSGKSYTIRGEQQEAGLIPHLCRELFHSVLVPRRDGPSIAVAVSYYEIYNEKVYDLLSSNAAPLKVMVVPRDDDYEVIIKDVVRTPVKSSLEMASLLVKGSTRLSMNKTNVNERASRSHSIFSVYMTCYGEHTERAGQLNIVDLAGSEHVKSSGVNGEIFRETCHINQSLTALTRVIRSINARAPRKHIPYRDSKLTTLLSNSLGGNCVTFMIATVAPTASSYMDTLKTLRFAESVAKVNNAPRPNEIMSTAQLERKTLFSVMGPTPPETAAERLQRVQRQEGTLLKLIAALQLDPHANNRPIAGCATPPTREALREVTNCYPLTDRPKARQASLVVSGAKGSYFEQFERLRSAKRPGGARSPSPAPGRPRYAERAPENPTENPTEASSPPPPPPPGDEHRELLIRKLKHSVPNDGWLYYAYTTFTALLTTYANGFAQGLSANECITRHYTRLATRATCEEDTNRFDTFNISDIIHYLNAYLGNAFKTEHITVIPGRGMRERVYSNVRHLVHPFAPPKYLFFSCPEMGDDISKCTQNIFPKGYYVLTPDPVVAVNWGTQLLLCECFVGAQSLHRVGEIDLEDGRKDRVDCVHISKYATATAGPHALADCYIFWNAAQILPHFRIDVGLRSPASPEEPDLFRRVSAWREEMGEDRNLTASLSSMKQEIDILQTSNGQLMGKLLEHEKRRLAAARLMAEVHSMVLDEQTSRSELEQSEYWDREDILQLKIKATQSLYEEAMNERDEYRCEIESLKRFIEARSPQGESQGRLDAADSKVCQTEDGFPKGTKSVQTDFEMEVLETPEADDQISTIENTPLGQTWLLEEGIDLGLDRLLPEPDNALPSPFADEPSPTALSIPKIQEVTRKPIDLSLSPMSTVISPPSRRKEGDRCCAVM